VAVRTSVTPCPREEVGANPKAVSLNDGTGQGNNIAVFPTKLPETALTIASQGDDEAYKNVQPTIICNYIIRII
jgi:microcystin-dependent protein